MQTPKHLEGPYVEGDPERRLPEAPVWFSYVENKSLEDRFEDKRRELERQSEPDRSRVRLSNLGWSFLALKVPSDTPYLNSWRINLAKTLKHFATWVKCTKFLTN